MLGYILIMKYSFQQTSSINQKPFKTVYMDFEIFYKQCQALPSALVGNQYINIQIIIFYAKCCFLHVKEISLSNMKLLYIMQSAAFCMSRKSIYKLSN